MTIPDTKVISSSTGGIGGESSSNATVESFSSTSKSSSIDKRCLFDVEVRLPSFSFDCFLGADELIFLPNPMSSSSQSSVRAKLLVLGGEIDVLQNKCTYVQQNQGVVFWYNRINARKTAVLTGKWSMLIEHFHKNPRPSLTCPNRLGISNSKWDK